MISGAPGSDVEQLPARLPLVGRGDELRVLVEGLQGGGPPITILTGPGGIGKSRLAAATADRAEGDGWSIVRGQAFPVETDVPYALFGDAFLPLLLKLEPETLTVLSRGGERELSWLFPALAQDDDTGRPGRDPDEFRTRLFWNFAEFLKRLADRNRLLVVLEDLQWADESSLRLLHFLARQVDDDSLRFLCTYDETERHRKESLIRTERSLLSMGLARRLKLEPVGRDATVELVCRSFEVDESVAREFAALLFGWTRGNPFFLEETLKGLVESGKLYRREDTWLGWEVREPALPASIRDAVLARVGRLSPAAAETAELVAVMGTRASHRLLEAISDLRAPELLAALEELCDAAVLAESEERGSVVYSFVHPLVRQTLYHELGLARTRMLHGRVAEAMEKHYGTEAMDQAHELAFHYARSHGGHLTGKAVRYLAAAGRSALARRADREAANFLHQALEWARVPEAVSAGPGSEVHTIETADLMVDLARAHQHLGEYEEADRCWNEAWGLTETSDHRRRAEIRRYQALSRVWSGRLDEGMALLDAAEEEARGAGDPTLLARTLLSRGIFLQDIGRATEARDEIESALEIARDVGDDALLARVYRSLALVHVWTGPPSAVREHAERALELAARVDSAQVAFWSRWGLSVVHGLTGNTGEMAREIEKARSLAEELRSPVLRLWTAEVSIEHAFATGDWDAGLALGEKAIALARSLNQRMLLPRLLIWTSSIYLGRGDLDRGKELVDEACRLAGVEEERGARSVHALVPAHIGLAHYHLTVGEYEKAIEVGEKGLAIADGTGYVLWALHRLLPVVAEAYLWLEDTEGARRMADLMRHHADKLDHRLGRAWADACEAMIVWKEGDPARGAISMRQAAEALEAVPMVPAAARVRRQLAGRLAEIGDEDASVTELRRVHDTFTRLGAERELEKTRIQFREVGRRPPPRHAGAGPSALTDREMEVAHLVAQGKSNKAAGKALDISPRTVSTHLSNIFQKLEVGSRTELAALMRQGKIPD